MRKCFFIALVCLTTVELKGQEGVNYKPKALLSELSKYINESDLQELQIKDSLFQKRLWKGKYFMFPYKKPECPIKYVYIGRVNSCRAGGCSISRPDKGTDETEYFDYYILFDKSISVYKVKIFNYRATHGHEVTAPGWLKQFIGYNGNTRLDVGNGIDAISGATISVYGITADIENKTKYLQQIISNKHIN